MRNGYYEAHTAITPISELFSPPSTPLVESDRHNTRSKTKLGLLGGPTMPNEPTAEESICQWVARQQPQSNSLSADQIIGLWVGVGIVGLILACRLLPQDSSNSGNLSTSARTNELTEQEFQTHKNQPSLSGWNDSEKRRIMQAAKNLDAAIKARERRISP